MNDAKVLGLALLLLAVGASGKKTPAILCSEGEFYERHGLHACMPSEGCGKPCAGETPERCCPDTYTWRCTHPTDTACLLGNGTSARAPTPAPVDYGARQGAPLTTPPLIYLKLHKTGSETMEVYFEKLAKLDWRQRTERYAWPTKAPETI